MKSIIFCAALISAVFVSQSAYVNVTNGVPGPLYVVAVPKSNKVYAGTDKQGIYMTTNGGTNWTKCGSGAGSMNVNCMITKIVVDSMNADAFWACGIYGSGPCKSVDGGVTITPLGSTQSHNDYIGVDFTDPQRRTLVISGHESALNLYLSTDGGQTWPSNIGMNLPSNSAFSSQFCILDSNTFVVACGGQFGSGIPGIFRTTDKGTTWTNVFDSTGIIMYGDPLVTSRKYIFFTEIYNRGVWRSINQGVAWGMSAWGNMVSFGVKMIELPNGRLVGSTYGNGSGYGLSISANGQTWTALGDRLSSRADDLTYSAGLKAFFVVSGDALYRYDYEWSTRVSDVPVQSTSFPSFSNSMLRISGLGQFQVPAGLNASVVAVAAFTVDGKLIAALTASPGQKISVPENMAHQVSVIKIEKVR